MLLIETYLEMVPSKGIGLFTKEAIASGQVYWSRNADFDIVRTPLQMQALKEQQKKFIQNYGFLEPTGNWYLCIDNARFSNHAFSANTDNRFNELGELIECYATRDIRAGEEILCNYQDLCETCKIDLGFTPVV